MDTDLNKVAMERWRIAYEVLEEEFNTHAKESAQVIESLNETIANLLRERNERIDMKFDGKATTVDNSAD